MKMSLIERLVYPLARGMIRQAFEEGFKGADEAGKMHRENAIAHRETIKELESTLSELQDRVKELENPWIDVSDRLPEDLETVFALWGGKNPLIAFHRDDGWPGWKEGAITHWMKIPPITGAG